MRKILLVISDGAPVDDSTLMENGADILHNHLKDVVDHLEAIPNLRVGAVGVGFDVSRYYKNAKVLHTANELGEAVLDQLYSLINYQDISNKVT